ncbi:MAG: integrase, partial [Clostridia bacterium]|nr:integrase [Clostridia bacterium]
MSEFHSAFSNLIEQFISYRIASGTWNTINYEYCIKRFDAFCAKNYPNMPLSQEMVDDWCSCHPNEMNRSRNTRIRVITAFIKYLRKRNLTEVETPALLVNEPHTYIPHSFKEEELRRFFYECDHIQPKTKRLESILPKYICPVLFRLLYSSGIRTTEARQLARKNVDITHGILDIQRSKGYDQHYVALHPSIT